MGKLIDFCIRNSRAMLLLFTLISFFGIASYVSMPKEEAPEVKIPLLIVTVVQQGLSPEDAEKMVLKPLETKLRSVQGVKKMTSYAVNSRASIVLEFDAGFDSELALNKVKDKVDEAKPKMPKDIEEPVIEEVDFSQFPVLNVTLYGDIPQDAMILAARSLRDKIEGLSEVLKVNLIGDMEDSVEILISPAKLNQYNLSTDVISAIAQNNQLVASGFLTYKNGNFAIKVSGLVNDINDIIRMPIRASGSSVVKLMDIATVKKSYKDPQTISRLNGLSSVTLAVSKRSGKNVISTIEKVKFVVSEVQKFWPAGVKVQYSQDSSAKIKESLHNLVNSIIFATVLVVLVIIYYIGIRQGLLSSVAIPASFFMGILVLSLLNLTLNIVVLFSLILAVGMIVDATIIVTEYADRKMIDGMSHKDAYVVAAKRMALPAISSVATILIVFAPLLFWPGTVGKFMRYMPITLLAVLVSSILVALIFVPIFGRLFGGKAHVSEEELDFVRITESGDLMRLRGFMGWYMRSLTWVLEHAKLYCVIITIAVFFCFRIYGTFGKGVEFFPSIEPSNVQLVARARGNLSIEQKSEMMKEAERRIIDIKGVKVFNTKVFAVMTDVNSLPVDTIGVIQMELEDWRHRPRASAILKKIQELTEDMSGVKIDLEKEREGPSSGKPIQIEVSSLSQELIDRYVDKLVLFLASDSSYKNVEDTRPPSKIEWDMKFSRELAAKYDVSVTSFGNFVKLATNGIKLSDYRPNYSDKEVDLLLRFDRADRNLTELQNLKINTVRGPVPISNFSTIVPKKELGQIVRIDGARTIAVKSDVADGVLANNKLEEIKRWIEHNPPAEGVSLKFAGDKEEQARTGKFLTTAFLLAIFTMVLMMLLQFNSWFSTGVIMSAIFFSTGGVFVALLITNQAFGIVMCGVGIIALSGIIVSHNIIFIDTYDKLIASKVSQLEAIMRTAAQRTKPILLTTATTTLGLLPLVFSVDLDFIKRDITYNSPSSQWWNQLATTITGGLAFSTLITLFLTPALLWLKKQR